MPEETNQGNGSLAEIVSETAQESRRLAIESVRGIEDKEERNSVYKKMISEELRKENTEGAVRFIEKEMEGDLYCQSLGYLVIAEHNKAREMIDLSLEIAANAPEKDELYCKIVYAGLNLDDVNEAESLVDDIDDPYHKSLASLAIARYQFSKEEAKKAEKRLKSVITTARKIQDDNKKAEVFHNIITLKLDYGDDPKGAIKLAKKMPGVYRRNLAFRNIIFYKVVEDDLDGIKELLDGMDENSPKLDAVEAVIEKEVEIEIKEGEDRDDLLIRKFNEYIEDPHLRGSYQENLVGKRIREGNFDRAVKIADRITDEWYNSIANKALLEFRLRENDISGAEEFLDKIKSDVYRAEAIVSLSKAEYRLGQKDAARERLSEAIRFTTEECEQRWVGNLFKNQIIPVQIYEEDLEGAVGSAVNINDLDDRSRVYTDLSLQYLEKEDFDKAVDIIKLSFSTAKDIEYDYWQSQRFLDITNACNRILERLKEKGEKIPEAKKKKLEQSLLGLLGQLGGEAQNA